MPLRAFEFIYVDINLSNKQKRQRIVVRAADKNAATSMFWDSLANLLGPASCSMKIIQTNEVEAEARPASLADLATAFKARKPNLLVAQ